MKKSKANPRHKRFLSYQEGLERLLGKLEAQGDFDANAPTIRAVAITLYETMSYVRHLKEKYDALSKD